MVTTVACGIASASFICRPGGTTESLVVTRTDTGTSTSPIHVCEVKSDTATSAAVTVDMLVRLISARTYLRLSSSMLFRYPVPKASACSERRRGLDLAATANAGESDEIRRSVGDPRKLRDA